MADFDGVASVRAWLKALAGRLGADQPARQSLPAG
jgi:hypothetical protein